MHVLAFRVNILYLMSYFTLLSNEGFEHCIMDMYIDIYIDVDACMVEATS